MDIRDIAIRLAYTARQLLVYGRAYYFYTDYDAKRSYPAMEKKGLVRLVDEEWERTPLGDQVAEICLTPEIETAIKIRSLTTAVRQIRVRQRTVYLGPHMRNECHLELKAFQQAVADVYGVFDDEPRPARDRPGCW